MIATARFTREGLLRGASMGGHEGGEEGDPVMPVLWVCPGCGTPYGKRARCYACRPGRPKAAEIERRAAIREGRAGVRRPVVPAAAGETPAAVMRREFDAIMAVAEALDGLDRASVARVLDWVASHLGVEKGGR
jgi:hypothetical protein